MATLTIEQIRKADSYIDEHHGKFTQLGQELFGTFQYEKDKNQLSTQIRNLQQIACSARRFADIEDFVKNQMGKEKGNSRKWRSVGPEVLQQLGDLRQASQQADADEEQRFLLRLQYARGWVRAVVGEYLYQVACDQMERAT